jgi:hypothetical protein
MLLLLDLRDQTFANQNRILSRHELTNPLQLDALDDWTRQTPPVLRLRCACRQEKRVDYKAL